MKLRWWLIALLTACLISAGAIALAGHGRHRAPILVDGYPMAVEPSAHLREFLHELEGIRYSQQNLPDEVQYRVISAARELVKDPEMPLGEKLTVLHWTSRCTRDPLTKLRDAVYEEMQSAGTQDARFLCTLAGVYEQCANRAASTYSHGMKMSPELLRPSDWQRAAELYAQAFEQAPDEGLIALKVMHTRLLGAGLDRHGGGELQASPEERDRLYQETIHLLKQYVRGKGARLLARPPYLFFADEVEELPPRERGVLEWNGAFYQGTPVYRFFLLPEAMKRADTEALIVLLDFAASDLGIHKQKLGVTLHEDIDSAYAVLLGLKRLKLDADRSQQVSELTADCEELRKDYWDADKQAWPPAWRRCLYRLAGNRDAIYTQQREVVREFRPKLSALIARIIALVRTVNPDDFPKREGARGPVFLGSGRFISNGD